MDMPQSPAHCRGASRIQDALEAVCSGSSLSSHLPQLPSVEGKSVLKPLAAGKMFVFRCLLFLKIILITHFSLKNHSAFIFSLIQDLVRI